MNRLWAGVVLMIVVFGLQSCAVYNTLRGKKSTPVTPENKRADAGAFHQTDSGVHHVAILPAPDTTSYVSDQSTTHFVNSLIDTLTPLWHTRLSYTTFSGKAKMKYQGPSDKQDFTANFRIKKDSVIWIAVTAVGGMVQVARIYVTPDSFFMVNYLQKEAFRMPLSQAAKVLPVAIDFSTLQNLIVGEPLVDKGKITDATSFGGAWSIEVTDVNYVQRIAYNKEDSTMRTGQLRTADPNGPQAMIQYGNYETNEGKKTSTGRVVNIQNGADQYSLDMNFTRIDFDQPLEYPFSIPDKYTIK